MEVERCYLRLETLTKENGQMEGFMVLELILGRKVIYTKDSIYMEKKTDKELFTTPLVQTSKELGEMENEMDQVRF